jgi:regulator of RNase E activity RraA
MVSHAYVHLIDFGDPVCVGGVTVNTGDLVHGDQHGVQVIPPELVPRLPAVCEEIIAKERRVISYCQSDAFTLEGLKKLIP